MRLLKTTYRLQALVVVAAQILSACDCIQTASGVVLDKRSKRPVDGVTIDNPNFSAPTGFRKVYSSDSVGRFRVTYSLLGKGTLSGCPDLQLIFSKNGYRSSRVTRKTVSMDDTIYLEKTSR